MNPPAKLHRHFKRLNNLLRRPWADHWLLAQVFAWLGITRLAINVLPFRRLAQYLGPHQQETAVEASSAELDTAQRIAWAIQRISPHTPWTSNCFPQALTAKLLLRRHGIPSTLYLGAAFSADKTNGQAAGLEAHAWLRCGTVYVTGGRGHERFGVVGIFGA